MALQVTNSCLKVFEAISKVAEAEGTPERRKQEVEYVYIIVINKGIYHRV